MPVLVNIKYEDNKIKMKALPFGQHFPHYKSIGKVFHHSRAMNSEAKWGKGGSAINGK